MNWLVVARFREGPSVGNTRHANELRCYTQVVELILGRAGRTAREKKMGQPKPRRRRRRNNVVNLMGALRVGLKSEEKTPAKKVTKKRKAG